MYKTLLAVLLALALAGCKPSSTSTSATSSTSPAASSTSANDAVQQKLAELAGGSGTNCGRLSSQATADLERVSKCAMDAAQKKQAFYAAYDMPGMTVGVVSNAEGKLFSVQSQTGGSGLVSEPCQKQLRVAPSGRVTCYPPGTFPMGAGAGSHTNMTMPPAMGANPHKQKPADHP